MIEVDRDETLELVALDLLTRTDGPVGAVRLAEAFQEAGHDLAQATAGRFLRSLDIKGYTQADGGKRGRSVTDQGVRRLEELRSRAELRSRGVQIMQAATINDLSDLYEMLLVRRAVESEGAWLAALRGSDAELQAIHTVAERILAGVRAGRVPDSASSVAFHRSIAEASHNAMLVSVAVVLLEPQNAAITNALEDVSVTAAQVLRFAEDHLAIARALVARDEEGARQAMYQHITATIDSVARRMDAWPPDRVAAVPSIETLNGK